MRWPSKKFKATRRFCYVQFTSPVRLSLPPCFREFISAVYSCIFASPYDLVRPWRMLGRSQSVPRTSRSRTRAEPPAQRLHLQSRTQEGEDGRGREREGSVRFGIEQVCGQVGFGEGIQDRESALSLRLWEYVGLLIFGDLRCARWLSMDLSKRSG